MLTIGVNLDSMSKTEFIGMADPRHDRATFALVVRQPDQMNIVALRLPLELLLCNEVTAVINQNNRQLVWQQGINDLTNGATVVVAWDQKASVVITH